MAYRRLNSAHEGCGNARVSGVSGQGEGGRTYVLVGKVSGGALRLGEEVLELAEDLGSLSLCKRGEEGRLSEPAAKKSATREGGRR
jgi:hypothetical protein